MLLFLLFLLLPFVSTAQHKQLVKTVYLPCQVEDAWKKWTTVEGVQSFLAQDGRIEAAVGGKYEILFIKDSEPGKQGSEGCRITNYAPNHQLAFTWNAPVSFGKLREQHTEVFINFESTGPHSCKLTLGHVGWKEGAEWDKLYEYFDGAWGHVLSALQKRVIADQEAAMDWITGAWQQIGKSGTYEVWENPEAPGLTARNFKVTEAGDTTFVEELAIEINPGGISLSANILLPDGDNKLTEFQLSKLAGQKMLFSNPNHDFPQEIDYERQGDELIATISLIGGTQPEVFRFRRVNR